MLVGFSIDLSVVGYISKMIIIIIKIFPFQIIIQNRGEFSEENKYSV